MLRKFSFFSITNYALLLLLAFCMVYPFVYILAYSLNDGLDSMKGGISFWPRQFTLENYIEVFKDPAIMNAYKITIARTVVGTLTHLIVTTLFAYALSKRTLPGRNFISFFIFIPTIFGGGFIPYFILMQRLHLYNSFWVYIIPALYNFFHIVVMRTFFQQIPPELEESAKIDGYGDVAIFLKIILPLSGSVISVIAIFMGVSHWNDWFTGTFFISDKNLVPVQTLLQEMLTRSEALLDAVKRASQFGGNTMSPAGTQAVRITPESLRMAVLAIATVPILVIYPFFQKHFVKGALLGSVKG
ncbi:carbohydrate ABC transporter permease [Paenibacillus albus]|uniref:Carbohydrate ABC transporter permease n=1 Tax=Paenibacillus albus TaxID=2495582 RepID=A0A3Q8X8L1_9BACL|nr:carbohydrate ABC transporter permease [Paenibacillus albus]AZN41329.1 carbohydrate ABC transporter permease [Paenibacillus albus]